MCTIDSFTTAYLTISTSQTLVLKLFSEDFVFIYLRQWFLFIWKELLRSGSGGGSSGGPIINFVSNLFDKVK